MPTYVIPAVYDTAKKYIRPIGRGERLLPEYFGIVLDGLLSENAGQSLTVDAAGKLHCLAVSRDARNLIMQGTDKGAYLDASQMLSNGATNLLTTNPHDRRVMLTKQSLLDAGLADVTTVYSAVQEHVAEISAAKEAAANSAATAKAGATTVTRYITEAESIIREEAAGIAAESITAQVVSKAAEKASELVDNRQDKSIAALTTRVNQVETNSANELNTLNANWTKNFTSVTKTNVEQSEVIAQIIDKNNAQDRAIKDLQDTDVQHDERLNFLKCKTEELDVRIYQNFVCLVQRITDTENRLNARITTEVTRLEDVIAKTKKQLVQKIEDIEDRLNARITTEVTRLDDEIRRINATQAAAWTNISRTLTEMSERFLADEMQHKKDVKDIHDRITNEVEILDDKIIKTNANVAENFAKVALTDSEQAENIAKLNLELQETNANVTENFVKVALTDSEQASVISQLYLDFSLLNRSVAENFTKIAYTDTEQAVNIANLCNDTNAIDRRLSENIVHQERINVEQFEYVLEFKQHQLNNVSRFSDLAYASVVHTHELKALDLGFVAMCANLIAVVRANIEQTFLLFQLIQGSEGTISGGLDFGDLG